MKRTILACSFTAVLTCAVTLLAVRSPAFAQVLQDIILDNPRVKVTRIIHPPGEARPRHTRSTDQVIVFLDDCSYERTNSASGSKSIQTRKSGDVIWHNKGDDAPVLVGASKTAYRTILIELK
jgi:hypothetical protein